MNTIAKRKELIEEAMKQFEQYKNLNWPWLTGFYASLLSNIAADRPQDTEEVVQAMMTLMEKSK